MAMFNSSEKAVVSRSMRAAIKRFYLNRSRPGIHIGKGNSSAMALGGIDRFSRNLGRYREMLSGTRIANKFATKSIP